MERALSDLISRYVDVAADLFPRVAAHVGAKLPISNIEWSCLGIEQRGETPDGVKYFKHGYGVAMNDGSRFIDFDLGQEGQMTGFDAWRLFEFAKRNSLDIPYEDIKALNSAIQGAANDGEIHYSGYLLYYRAYEI